VPYLILGLLIFLGVHSVRIVADDWRTRNLTRLGALPWKAWYSVASLVGFALIVWGFGLARQLPLQLWQPPLAMRHLASVLTLISFVLLAAAYVPCNSIPIFVNLHPFSRPNRPQTSMNAGLCKKSKFEAEISAG